MNRPENIQVGEEIYFSRQDKVGLIYAAYDRETSEHPGVHKDSSIC
jgi:hypothetical protein